MGGRRRWRSRCGIVKRHSPILTEVSDSLETWNSADAYDLYVGRWSREVARDFVEWLAPARHLDWVDVGCGTGQLTASVLSTSYPRRVAAIDRALDYLRHARGHVSDERASFAVGDATSLPLSDQSSDVAVSGLVLNFVPDHIAMVREMARITKRGGTVAVYVWDYAGRMEMIRRFWDAAVEVNPNDAQLDQAERFLICRPEALHDLFRRAGLGAPSVRAIDVQTVFADFDDLWTPFLGGQGAAPTYLESLDPETQIRIREVVRAGLPLQGPIELTARAWAVRATV